MTMLSRWLRTLVKSKPQRGFPGDPVVKILYFQCRESGLDPWLGKQDPTCHMAKKIKIKKPQNDLSKHYNREGGNKIYHFFTNTVNHSPT